MFFSHRRSLFPLLVVCLTMVLVGFIFVSTRSFEQADRETAEVTETEYTASAKEILLDFFSSYESASSNPTRQNAVQQAMSALLRVRVPVSKKDLHLELVLHLQRLKDILQTNQDATEALKAFREAVTRASLNPV